MRDTEQIITEWLSGVMTSMSPVGRTVVVETDEWIPVLVSTGVVDARTALVHRGETEAPITGWSRTYTGTFHDPAADLIFADGFRLRQTRYGLADFSCLDAPTALVLLDEHDFSAFLRDADISWNSGVFANHVTHPLAVVANVAALGAATSGSGPDRRLFVDSDGAISTSPFGSPLGRVGQDVGAVMAQWNSLQHHEVQDDGGSDGVALRNVLQHRDRLDAIAERAWLPRYFEAAAAVRSIRAEHLAPGRVSGFAGRLAGSNGAAMPASTRPDDCGLPVLVELGDAVRAVDPASGLSTLLTAPQVAAAEKMLEAGADGAGADGAGADGAGADLSRTLAAAGLPTDWLRRRLATAPTGGPDA